MIPENVPTHFSHAVLVTGSRSWFDRAAMVHTFNQLWIQWGPQSVTRPVLLSGHARDGADAMAEALWRDNDMEVLPFPADWSTHGRAAGLRRNQQMVDALQVLRDGGTQVVATAFLDYCTRGPACPQSSRQQLMPPTPGHFSHGTIHCRQAALKARIDVVDVLGPQVAPF